MKVLMIIERYLPIWGGSENQLRQLSRRLTDKGIGVAIATRRWHKKLDRFEVIDGIDVHRLGLQGNGGVARVAFIFSLIVFVIRTRKSFDLYHSHGAVKMGAVSALSAKISRKKNIAKIATAGHIEALQKSFLGKRVISLFKKSTAVIAMTDEIEREMVQIGLDSTTIWRIANGIDCERFKPVSKEKKKLLKQSHDFGDRDILFMFSGRLVYRKGLDILIDIWGQLLEKHPDSKLIILGSGFGQEDSIELAIRDSVAKRNLSHIFFMGETSEPEQYLAMADIYVFPSRREGFPNALMEAMASGLPVVGSNIGGVVDLITDGSDGLLFELDDSQMLLEKMCDLAGDPGRREKMGENARQSVDDRYSFNKISAEYVSLYVRQLRS